MQVAEGTAQIEELVAGGRASNSANLPWAFNAEHPRQIVLILVGLVGSGKSTFAHALQEYIPNFHICNQDDLGDRRAVETLARSTLREGHSVAIDRTNFNESQRATWVKIAREVPGCLVWVLVFDTPYAICAERLRLRTSHPTITSPQQGIEVLQRFIAQYRAPYASEGFDQMLTLSVADQPTEGLYTRTAVENILARLQQSPRISPLQWRVSTGFGRGSRAGYQGHYSPSRGRNPRERGRWGMSPQQPWRAEGS